MGNRQGCRVHILSVCPWLQLSSIQSACAVLYCHPWPVWLYHFFPHYLINATILGGVGGGGRGGGGLIQPEMCVLISSIISDSSRNS